MMRTSTNAAAPTTSLTCRRSAPESTAHPAGEPPTSARVPPVASPFADPALEAAFAAHAFRESLPLVVAFYLAAKAWRTSQGSDKPIVNLVAIFALVVARGLDFLRKVYRAQDPQTRIPAAFQAIDKEKAKAKAKAA